MKKTNTERPIPVGIIYIAIGIYDKFWDIFYPSCEKFFCCDMLKGYEVFTDSQRLISQCINNVTWHKVKNKGFIYNVSSKSKFICSISEILKDKYDYIYYLNGNLKFTKYIFSNEILPTATNDWIVALSFNCYKNIKVDLYPYDRNPQCNAYIPFGEGKYYYQGGFYGGRTEEIILMSNWIKDRIEIDLGKKIIARWHDESYINLYLLKLNPKILDETFALAEEASNMQFHKAILLNKKKYLGHKFNEIKDLSINNSLSFLLDQNFNIKKIGIIRMKGRLGNQLFQYAYLLFMRKKTNYQIPFYFSYIGSKEILSSFPNLSKYQLPKGWNELINNVDYEQKYIVQEQGISEIEKIIYPKKAITEYNGYWQCVQYADEVRTELMTSLMWNEKALNMNEKDLQTSIINTCSISMHIRRGDYMSEVNYSIYGKVCTIDYYHRAIDMIKKLVQKDINIYIFTDDIPWVKANFKDPKFTIVETSVEWKDLFLMSLCKHHIISNSSFSWWGAWLGNFPNKVIIAPKWWYYGMKAPDLLPKSWIKLSLEKEPTLIDIKKAFLFWNRIYNYKQDFNQSLGMHGQMGKVVAFFSLYEESKEIEWKKKGEQLLENLIDKCNYNTPLGYEDGLCGIGIGIQKLMERKHIKGDINEILSDFDLQFVQTVNSLSITDKILKENWFDIGYYLFHRYYKNTSLSKIIQIKKTLKKWSKWLSITLLTEYNYSYLFNYIFLGIRKSKNKIILDIGELNSQLITRRNIFIIIPLNKIFLNKKLDFNKNNIIIKKNMPIHIYILSRHKNSIIHGKILNILPVKYYKEYSILEIELITNTYNN